MVGPAVGPQPGFAPEQPQPNMQYQQPNYAPAPAPAQPQPNMQYQQPNYAPAPGPQFNQQGYAQPAGVQYVPPIQAPQIQRPSFNVPWSTGLFDCCDDPSNALITFCAPCVTFGQVAEIIDQGSSSCATHATIYSCIWFWIWCPCLLSCSYRTKLRAKYELMESPAPDWVTHFLCEFCALCQMHRELMNRGLDPSIGKFCVYNYMLLVTCSALLVILGWLANVHRMQQQQMQPMAAPAHQAMM